MDKVIILFCALFLSVSTMLPSAQACQNWKELSTDDVMLGMGTKFVRGIVNTATGVLEIPRSIYVTSRDQGIGQGIFVGPFQGILTGTLRTLAGVAEVATFVVPAPRCYGPYLDRPLVWSDVNQQEGFLIFPNHSPQNQ